MAPTRFAALFQKDQGPNAKQSLFEPSILDGFKQAAIQETTANGAKKHDARSAAAPSDSAEIYPAKALSDTQKNILMQKKKKTALQEAAAKRMTIKKDTTIFKSRGS